jgi:hypothetical protein
MGLLDAPEYDPGPAERRWRIVKISIGVGGTLLLVFLSFWFWPNGRFRHWRQWSIATDFFAALQQKDFDTAYALYNAAPDWKQHPEKYNQYPLPQFTLDWGPSSDIGVLNSFRVDCAKEPESKGSVSSSGVIVVVTVNDRSEPAYLWIEKKSRTITTSPYKVICHPR